MKTLKDLIKGNTAKFQRYRDGKLVYAIMGESIAGHRAPARVVPVKLLEFEVPVEELDGATVGAEETASTFLKWVRKALKDIIENEEIEDGS